MRKDLLLAFLCFVVLLPIYINGQTCPSEDDLIHQFQAAAKVYKIYNSKGEACTIPHDHDDDHNHRRKKRDHHDDEDDDDHHDEDDSPVVNVTCHTIYDVCRSVILDLSLTTEECLQHDHDHDGNGTTSSAVTSAEAYGYGFLMILLVSLCSLGGVILVPIITSKSDTGKHIYELVFAFMVALAVSALVTDAVLHLIPHAVGLHNHNHEEEEGDGHDHGHEGGEDLDFIWKGVLVILGLYGFYIMEFILHSLGHNHSTMQDGEDCHAENGSSPTEDVHYIKDNDVKLLLKDKEKPAPNSYTALVSNADTRSSKLCVHPKKIKNVAWLIIVGDTIHNLADGIALGAAISQSLALGLSTMLALVFHELPHEFGDFVILVNSGFHWVIALSINVLQNLGAIIGLFIGVAVSSNSESASNWILAITAGLFLYVALTDLLPELVQGEKHGPRKQRGFLDKNHWLRFLLINLGFFTSFVILLLISIYEEDLNTLI